MNDFQRIGPMSHPDPREFEPITPPCIICQRPSEWQIGTYVMFRSRASFYCNYCLPEWARKEAEKRGL